MAKDDKSKSEAIPGGVKASDLPANVGGTKGDGAARNESAPTAATHPANHGDRPAPVTTDAGMKNPPANLDDDALAPVGPARPAARPGEDFGPSDLRGAFPSRPKRGPGSPQGQKSFQGLPQGLSGRFAGAGEDDSDASDISVKDLFGLFKQFISDAKSRNVGGLMRDGAGILAVFSHLMEGGGLFGVTAEDAQAISQMDSVQNELASCRENIAGLMQSGNHVTWGGDGFDPTSGSPPPLAKVKGSDAQAISPQTLLVLFELVQQIWSLFRQKTAAAS